MANAVITVLEADGVTQTDIVSLDVGRQAAAASKSIAFSSEDFAVLDGIEATLTTIDGRVDGLETLVGTTNTTLTAIDGRVDGLETLVTSSNTKLDTLNTTMTDATIPLVAHDAADSGDPLKIGAKATASLSAATMVAAADRTNLFAGLDGVLINRPHTNLEDIVTGNATNTDGTSTSCIASSGAGIKTYLTSVVLCNTSATAITVDIKDGSTTKVSLPLPAGSGCVFNPPVPIPGTAATAWSFDPSAAATTVTCSMVGFKSKV